MTAGMVEETTGEPSAIVRRYVDGELVRDEAAPAPPLTPEGVAARLALLVVAVTVALAGLTLALGAHEVPDSGATVAPVAISVEPVNLAPVDPAPAPTTTTATSRSSENGEQGSQASQESSATAGSAVPTKTVDPGRAYAEGDRELTDAEVAAASLDDSGPAGYPRNPYGLPTDSGGNPITDENPVCAGAWSVGDDYGAGCTQFQNYVEQGSP